MSAVSLSDKSLGGVMLFDPLKGSHLMVSPFL